MEYYIIKVLQRLQTLWYQEKEFLKDLLYLQVKEHLIELLKSVKQTKENKYNLFFFLEFKSMSDKNAKMNMVV